MSDNIEVRVSGINGAGRGVFAIKGIKTGEVIETCPILILNENEFKYLGQTKLMDYVFDYDGHRTMLALGFGSLYNHGKAPNARYELWVEDGKSDQDNELCFIATRAIRKNEEIVINYGPDFDNRF